MAYESSAVLSALGNVIRVSHPTIPPNLVTYLSASSTNGGTSLSVLDNYPFAQNDYVVIGKLGLDKTEIQKVNAAVTQGTAVTTTATLYDHPIDAPVSKILWNQVEISGAATATGTKTVIATINLQPDRSDTAYVNAGTTYAFYFARFYNAQTGAFSAYSSAVPAGGYATSSVATVKRESLNVTNEKISDLITDQFLNDQILNCEQEVWSERKQWSWAYAFDFILGTTVEGGYSFALPSDIADNQSDKSILPKGLRIGDRPDMTYITKEEWDQFFILTRHTTVASSISVGDAVINLTSAADFDSSGSIVIGSDNAINYTGVTGNQLTGVTGIAASHSAGQDAWQNPQFQEPAFFTVFGGNLYFQAGCLSTYAGKNAYLSYYRKPTAIVDDNSTLNIPDWTTYHYFLAWKILLRKNNGKSTEESEKFLALYEKRKETLKKIDRTGQRVLMRPRLNAVRYPRSETRTTFLQMDSDGYGAN